MKRAPVALLMFIACAFPWSACTQQSTTVVVRSLERSGRSAFLCLNNNPVSDTPGQQLENCFGTSNAFAPNDYSIPHTLALVTQTSRGEVAVVDITAQSVLDADPTTPGFNFLPVGMLPTDIVATPGSTASFVSVGDPLRAGIFAIPSVKLPYQKQAQVATLGSWPACSLDAVPTEMVIVGDKTGMHPGLCGGDDSPPVAPGYDLSGESALFGRLKIVATLPDLGQIAVIDAQELLSRPAGSFDRCKIEATVALQTLPPGAPEGDAGAPVADAGASVDAAPEAGAPADAAGPDAGAEGGATFDAASCSGRVTSSPPPSLVPHPVSLALSEDGRLFVSDDSASVVHVVDVTNPCAPVERAPLLPYSMTDPTRAVVTSAIAVSNLTSDNKRFVYAVDKRGGGTVMAFDVSAGATERRPIVRPQADLVYNVFEPPDRIVFSAAVQSLTFINHDVVLGNPMGAVPRGIMCDPTVTDPNSPVFPYLPKADYASLGAGPRVLRGTFGFAVLENGRVSVIDVDDLDKACRRPAASDDPALGCDGKLMLDSATMGTPLPSSSDESSCNVVQRHRLRESLYFSSQLAAGQHAPAMQSFPLLYDKDGTLLPTDPMRAESATRPRLLGPSVANKAPATQGYLANVAGTPEAPGAVTGDISWIPERSANNWVAFDLRQPRSQFSQDWQITYEGVIPTLAGRRGRLQCLTQKSDSDCEGGSNPSSFVLLDATAGFCDQGAQGNDLAQSLNLPSGDIVQLVEPLPDPADPYWATVAGTCSYDTCVAGYGTADSPDTLLPGRDLLVDRAFEDRLVLAPNPGRAQNAPLACCFPYPPVYVVRAGRQWLVTGSTTPFLHHIIPDPTAPDPSTARCIASCDPTLALRNSRVAAHDQEESTPVYNGPVYDGPGVFRNPQLEFVIWNPLSPAHACATGNRPPRPDCPVVRDMSFLFHQSGGFSSLDTALSTGAVLPQSIRFVPGIGLLAIPDAAAQGLLLLDPNALSPTAIRAFY